MDKDGRPQGEEGGVSGTEAGLEAGLEAGSGPDCRGPWLVGGRCAPRPLVAASVSSGPSPKREEGKASRFEREKTRS